MRTTGGRFSGNALDVIPADTLVRQDGSQSDRRLLRALISSATGPVYPDVVYVQPAWYDPNI
jgi:hypothetical protein